MIHTEVESLLTLKSACRVWPGERKPCYLTLHRYALKGVLDANGNRVKLDTVKTGGSRQTSREAIQRFIAAINAPSSEMTITPAQRDSQHEAATACLKAAGVL